MIVEQLRYGSAASCRNFYRRNVLPSQFQTLQGSAPVNCEVGTNNHKLLQKERSPGVIPGFVWFRVPKVAPGIARRLRWWVNLGRTNGVTNSVVYCGESGRRMSNNSAAQKLAQKRSLRGRPMLQLRQEPPEVRGRQSLSIALRAHIWYRQGQAVCSAKCNHLRHRASQKPQRLGCVAAFFATKNVE